MEGHNFKLSYAEKNAIRVFFNKQIMSVALPSVKTHSVNRNNYCVVI